MTRFFATFVVVVRPKRRRRHENTLLSEKEASQFDPMSSHACEARDDPRVYIVGYGSLMSIESARRTMPDLDDFTPALIFGWRRHFNLVSISALRRGLVSDDALRTGTCEDHARVGPHIRCQGTWRRSRFVAGTLSVTPFVGGQGITVGPLLTVPF